MRLPPALILCTNSANWNILPEAIVTVNSFEIFKDLISQ